MPRAGKHWVTMATRRGGCAGPQSSTPSALVVGARATGMLLETECCMDRMRYLKLGEVPVPQFPHFKRKAFASSWGSCRVLGKGLRIIREVVLAWLRALR